MLRPLPDACYTCNVQYELRYKALEERLNTFMDKDQHSRDRARAADAAMSTGKNPNETSTRHTNSVDRQNSGCITFIYFPLSICQYLCVPLTNLN